MRKEINYILLFLCLTFSTQLFSAERDVTPKLIEVTQATMSSKIGLHASLLNNCLGAGKNIKFCRKSTEKLNVIDYKTILVNVYNDVFTPEQVSKMYEFYSTDLGIKYSKMMIFYLAKDMNYLMLGVAPKINKDEYEKIKKYRNSDTAIIEGKSNKSIQISVQNHLSKELKKIDWKQ